jgi:5-deoxy-glucuronate isomerase
MIVLPLAGSCVVTVDGERYDVAGRPSVFAGPSDLVYAPRDATVTVSTVDGGRFALCTARASRRLAPRYMAAADVPVLIRGTGNCSRQVHNFGFPDALDADRIIAVEVITPAGNWSSYPPHKHDEERPGQESVLEEIYYYEIRGENGMAYQRVYGTADRPIDVLAEVRTGDVVLIPHGWHGPAMAVPGYDLYYLNVMAGPGAERAWLICDDPAHGWIRDTWADQEVDPRLPMTGEGNS